MRNLENHKKLNNAAPPGRRRCLGMLSAGVVVTLLPSFAHAGAYDDFFRAVKTDDVRRVARRLLRDEAMTTIVVGKPAGAAVEPEKP